MIYFSIELHIELSLYKYLRKVHKFATFLYGMLENTFEFCFLFGYYYAYHAYERGHCSVKSIYKYILSLHRMNKEHFSCILLRLLCKPTNEIYIFNLMLCQKLLIVWYSIYVIIRHSSAKPPIRKGCVNLLLDTSLP